MSSNGTISFSKVHPAFELEGHTFQTRAVDPRDWAETLEAGTKGEAEAIKGGGIVLAVSAEGIENLILLAIVPEQHDEWRELRGQKAIDFGQLDAIRTWIWEQMTDRPFSSDSVSGPGPGSDEASSKDESPSPVGARSD